MDKAKYEAIAHKNLKYSSPTNDEMIDEIADLMRLTAGMTIFDVGCAKAEILIRIANRCQVKAIGIDSSEQYLTEAYAALAVDAPGADISLEQASIQIYQHPNAPYDAVMCINSTELFGSYDKALMEIAKLTKPHGIVLMGDYYWRKEPQAKLTAPFEVTKDYQSAIEIGMQEGLIPLFASVCTQVDLDRYIWMQANAIENYALDNPDDVDSVAMVDRARHMRNLYVEYGHETLGFGLFMFRKPG
jgi:ubiquinone/menaquinone biosynthesis C-methylase UbiE